MGKSIDQNSLYGSYIVTQLNDNVMDSKKLKIVFEASTNNVSGFGGCNSFFGTYTIDGNDISFGDIASSKKYCGEDIGVIENDFLTALRKSNTIELNDNVLVFSSQGVVILRAKKMMDKKSADKKMSAVEPIIIYKSLSRGSFDFIKISGTKVSISKDRNLKVFNDYSCTEDDHNELASIINNMDLETLDQLAAPTDKRLFDGAPIATLTIIKDKQEKTSQSFDHGHPPAEIEALVNKVLSIKENATKQ